MDSDAAARPRFRSSIEPFVDGDDGLFLLAEGSHHWLPGPLYAQLAPLLSGQHSIESIFEQLGERHEPDAILAALDDLQERQLLAQDRADLPRDQCAWWERCGVSPALAVQRIAQTPVVVQVAGNVDAKPLREALSRAGLRLGGVGEEGPLSVVLCNDALHPELAKINASALERSVPWLLVQPYGLQTWLGPVFVPFETGCWECLAQRLRWHRRVEGYLSERHPQRLAARAHMAANLPGTRAALEEAASAVLRWVGTADPRPLAGHVQATDGLTHSRSNHPLTRRPQCPACGQPAQTKASPFTLQPRPKSGVRDGGHRALGAAEVALQLERHVSPITGLVASVVPGERTGVPAQGSSWRIATFAADHNFSDMADRRFFLQEGLRRRSGGKGQTVGQARISALAESMERYCGVFDGTEPRIRSSAKALGPSALHPNEVLGYSEQQFANRETANQRDHKAHWVPLPFQPETQIDWTALWSLSQGQIGYLPTSLCYFGYTSQDPLFARADSNGCAAGAVPEEAVLQGLLELIERDAVALWWYSRARRRGVDLNTSHDPYVAQLLAHYRSLKRSLWVLDITSDLGVPTFAALSARTDKPQQDILYGFGAHLDPAVALSRALTEVNQSLDAVPLYGGPASAQTYRGSHDALAWWRSATLQNQRYLTASADEPAVRLQDIADVATDRIDSDVRLLVDRLAALGIEVLVLDQTRADVGLPVVRVLAPGLRHFWARFGQGRLYDVPVQQGWVSHRLDESELNPFVVQF